MDASTDAITQLAVSIAVVLTAILLKIPVPSVMVGVFFQ